MMNSNFFLRITEIEDRSMLFGSHTLYYDLHICTKYHSILMNSFYAITISIFLYELRLGSSVVRRDVTPPPIAYSSWPYDTVRYCTTAVSTDGSTKSYGGI